MGKNLSLKILNYQPDGSADQTWLDKFHKDNCNFRINEFKCDHWGPLNEIFNDVFYVKVLWNHRVDVYEFTEREDTLIEQLLQYSTRITRWCTSLPYRMGTNHRSLNSSKKNGIIRHIIGLWIPARVAPIRKRWSPTEQPFDRESAVFVQVFKRVFKHQPDNRPSNWASVKGFYSEFLWKKSGIDSRTKSKQCSRYCLLNSKHV